MATLPTRGPHPAFTPNHPYLFAPPIQAFPEDLAHMGPLHPKSEAAGRHLTPKSMSPCGSPVGVEHPGLHPLLQMAQPQEQEAFSSEYAREAARLAADGGTAAIAPKVCLVGNSARLIRVVVNAVSAPFRCILWADFLR